MIDIKEFIKKYNIDGYENYHKHTSHSNVVSPDSAALPEDYVKRTLELGAKTLCSTEHGSLISWVYYYDLAKKNNLKYIHSVEAYIVNDRFEKDSANYHIVLIARTENGRKQINNITTSSWEDGFYSKPRIDLSLLDKLKDEDIMITTACLGGILRQEDLTIFNYIKNKFKYFFLEIQANNTEKQIEHNRRCIQLSYQHKIPLIAGCDSHYILPENFDDREQFLKSKGISYDDEQGWYLDFPSVETLIERFFDQGIDERSIANAILNTKVLYRFEDIVFEKNVKVPTLYPSLTLEERYNTLDKIVYTNLEKYVASNNLDYDLYKKEIDYEMKAVKDTGMADYFLLAYESVKLGEQNGGVLTA